MNSVTITYDHTSCRIERGVLSTDVVNDLSETLSFEPAGAEFMRQSGRFGSKFNKAKQWDGRKRLYHKGHRTFPTGLLTQVVKILARHGYEADIDGKMNPRIDAAYVAFDAPVGWDMREYQQSAVDAAFRAERCMIKVATGGGKTVIAGHLIHKCATRTIFMVHTKDLLYQAKETFQSMYGEWNVGQVGDGVVQDGDIVVMTVQTAARALDVKYERDTTAEDEDAWLDKETDHADPLIRNILDSAGLVFMDECHRVAAPTATAVITAIRNAPYRFGLSASPWRDDGADLALEAVFGAIAVDIPASDLIAQEYLIAPTIRFRTPKAMRVPKGMKYATAYEEYVVSNDERNTIAVADATSKVRRGLPTLVLVRHVSHGVELHRRLEDSIGGTTTVAFLSGRDDAMHRKAVLDDLRAGRLACLVATTIADEGLDIKPLAGLVLVGGGKSSTRALQRVGRVLRPYPGKLRVEVTDFDDKCKWLIEHSAARRRIYESEPAFTVLDV
jgi:superfamily II DNA or RNA helicase